MTIRANHYDAAFEEFLRQGRVPYVAVNEARRSLLDDVSLKSLDFVVHSPNLGPLLVDVKGRRFPHPGESATRRWENWATADDLASMAQWETVFGGNYRALLVFAYLLPPETASDSQDQGQVPVMLTFRNRAYTFYGVWATEYQQAMKTRSPKWETVWLPTGTFRDLRFPLAELSRPADITKP
ncbi:hypothetical protein GC163_02905 [bacterium]|nr:hypothetical protein [bacterium]